MAVQPGHHLQGYEHKERLEHSTQRQIFKELERDRDRERENGLLKKAMSIVVMNIVKQLLINVKLQVQHLSRPDSIAYSKSLLYKSNESKLEILYFSKANNTDS